MSTQHPDGGVRGAPVIYDPATLGFYRAIPSERATHHAFPVDQAARLIDVSDPQVRERLLKAFDYRSALFNPVHIVDIALAALKAPREGDA